MKHLSHSLLCLALLASSSLALATETAPQPEASSAPAAASAAPAATPLEKVFQQMDSDLNGELSRDELKAQPRAALLLDNFSKIDKDKSNSLSIREVQAFLEKVRKDQEDFLNTLRSADKNGDGAWTLKELKSAKGKLSSLEKNFKAIDTNQDGKITEEEIAAFGNRLR